MVDSLIEFLSQPAFLDLPLYIWLFVALAVALVLGRGKK